MSELEKLAKEMQVAKQDWENAKAWKDAAEKAALDAGKAAWNAGVRYQDLRHSLERSALEAS